MSIFTRWTSLGQQSMRSASYANQQQAQVKTLADIYAMLELYYANEMTSRIWTDAGYSAGGNRSIYNPTRVAVDFYSGRVFGNIWSSDGLPLPDGTPSAVPFAPDVDEIVRLTAMTALGWSNWAKKKNRYVRTGGIYGDVFLKPTLDVDGRKVHVKVYDPRYLTEIEFNDRDDVVAYRIDVPDRRNDAQKTPYTYGERWDKESFTTYLDNREHGYDGMPHTQANPFGFVPGCWVNHRYIGGLHGAPVIDGVIPKIDELNAIVTPAHDFIEKLNKQPIWIASDKKFGDTDGVLVVNTEPDGSGRKRAGTIKGPADMRTGPLLQDMGLAASMLYVQQLLSEIENDLPETVVDKQLRERADIPGYAMPRMVTDTANKLYEAEGNYDGGLIDACQMMISMGAFAVRNGLWGPSSQLSEAQRMFGQFDLGSFDRGELAIDFMLRPLIPETAMERAELALVRESVKSPQGLVESGYSEEAIYGVDASGTILAPSPMPGIIEQRSQSQPTQSAGSLFSGLINQGAV